MNSKNWVLFVLMVVVWGSGWPLLKIGLSYVSPPTLIFHRFAFSAISLLPIAILLRNRLPRDRHVLWKICFFSLLYDSNVIIQTMGLGQENSGIISVLAYTQPLFVFCLAVPFLKEKTTTMKLLGTATGFIGVTVLFAGRIGSFTINSVLVSLFGAFLWGASIVYCKKFLSEVDPYVTQFLALSVGTLLSIGLNLTGKSFFFPIDVNYMLIVVYCSIGGLAMGNVIWLYLLEREEATILSGSSLIVPAIALLLGWLILGETLSSESLVGVGVTLLGIYVMHARDGKESRHG